MVRLKKWQLILIWTVAAALFATLFLIAAGTFLLVFPIAFVVFLVIGLVANWRGIKLRRNRPASPVDESIVDAEYTVITDRNRDER